MLLGRQHQSIYLAILVLLLVSNCTLCVLDDHLDRTLDVRPLIIMLVELHNRLLKRFLLLLVFLDNWLQRHFLLLDFFHLGNLSEIV